MDSVHQKEIIQPHIIYCFAGQLTNQLDATTYLEIAHNLANQGWWVSLVSADEDDAIFSDNVEGICFSTPDVYLLRNIIFHLKLAVYLLKHWNEIDVILFGQPSGPILYCLKFWRILQGNQLPLFVLDTRTVPMEDRKTATLRDKIRGFLYTSMNFIGNRWADGQTCITQRMAEMVKVPSDKLLGLWPSGVDVKQFFPASIVRQWPVQEAPVQLAYVGVLHYERNLMALCQAVEMANAEGMWFELTLTGSGTEQEDLRVFAEKTSGRIRVNGRVPHEAVPAVLAEAHLGVLPFPDEAKYRVSSPIKLFEYLAAGLPILATEITCHTDVIQGAAVAFWAKDATVFGLLEAMRKIWANREGLSQMGEESSRLAKNYTWAESGKKLSAALHLGLERQLQKTQQKSGYVPGSDE